MLKSSKNVSFFESPPNMMNQLPVYVRFKRTIPKRKKSHPHERNEQRHQKKRKAGKKRKKRKKRKRPKKEKKNRKTENGMLFFAFLAFKHKIR